MSSTGGDGGGGGGASTATITTPTTPQISSYFCYQCNRTISLTPSPSSDLACPICNGGFIEEVENPNPNTNPNPLPHPAFNPFTSSSGGDHHVSPFAPFLIPSQSSFDPIDLSDIFGAHGGGGGGGGGGTARSGFRDPDVFNPFQFLQNYLQNMGAGGSNIQFVIENASPDQVPGGGFRFPSSNMGDYFFGPGLEQLIQQLAENDPNRYGTPPASKSAVEGLPNVNVTKELLDSDSSQCAVCMDEFELGVEAKQMPCKHVFHPACILPWLELHNSCPVCRYELPTDDPDYEQRTRGDQAPSGGEGDGSRQTAGVRVGADRGGGGGGGVSDARLQDNLSNDRTVERRFRISLPWPFRASDSAAETSNSNTSADGNTGGESNPRNRENPGFGSETRQEELD